MPETITSSEVLSEMNVEARTILAFSVDEDIIKQVQWLPQGWNVAPPNAGPFKDANLLVIVSDRLLVQDKEGNPLSSQETNQLAVIGILAQNAERNVQGVIIAFGLSAKTDGAPGPYSVFKSAKTSFNKDISAKSGENSQVSEAWSFNSEGGEKISVRLKYDRSTPARANDAVTRAHSLTNPDFYRIYHADHALDVLQSSVISQKDYTITGLKLGKVFNGSEKLVHIISQPWAVRRVYVQERNR